MKKYIVHSTFAALIICGFTMSSLFPQYREITASGDYTFFEYSELQTKADIIALVKVVDKLSVDNSTLVLGEEGYLMDHYSTRQLDVIEY